jgi:hypothetical protein
MQQYGTNINSIARDMKQEQRVLHPSIADRVCAQRRPNVAGRRYNAKLKAAEEFVRLLEQGR